MGKVADDPRIGYAPPFAEVRKNAREDARKSAHEEAREDGHVIDLSLAGKGNYQARRGALIELIWFVIEACVINNKLLPLSSVRVALLRLFGAKIGTGCRFVHPLRVKAPWNLEVGDKCWFFALFDEYCETGRKALKFQLACEGEAGHGKHEIAGDGA